MSLESQQYDLRYLTTERCNLGCIMCVDEGVGIPTFRGGVKPPTPEQPVSRALDVFQSMLDVIGAAFIRNFNLTGGEPTLRGKKDLTAMIRFLDQSGISHWWLNSNAVLLTRDFVKALSDAGNKEVKINLPTMNPKTYEIVMRRKPELLLKQIAGIEECIREGWKTDINIPLMHGVNDTEEELAQYLRFSRQSQRSGQVTIKAFQLEKGMFGQPSDEQIWKTYHTPTTVLSNRLQLQDVGTGDFGRMHRYTATFPSNELMNLVIINDISPQTIDNFPTRRRSLALTHDLQLTRMWEKPLYTFDFSRRAKRLDTQWREALQLAQNS